ncbi:hypothetical protein SAMN06295967_1258 [Belliella buryatensis]|uniref:AAA+ ATPase domain-containing protein n=1 Tax=Belliella buryatensis TaxID=1500549 RepID=A0A239H5H5_9BACT|nr:DUF6079 family protein [Belliella buryatensis]SNS76462.1 hypothetical protein SAMN06295967_1258 [Belliella buryatensis]
MKYKELLNFEPITEVVKFSRTNEEDYQKSLVKTFVFSDTFKNTLIPLMIRNLDMNYSGEAFGLQVVGNYGTGKSHLMSLISLLAENEGLINLVNDEKPKNDLKTIAGKFKVLRFELGNTESLWEVITYQMEEYLKGLGINFSFDGHGPKPYFDKLLLMMSEFEEKFPDKGFLIVIDEMLAYLKGRSSADKLNQDLAVLQALGQACDRSKFKFIFGVQEMIYHSSEFQFAADMLQKVNDRYKDIMITKEDVAFIVKNRLLRKDEHQKQKIRRHLDPFLNLFTDMHARTQDYIELYPVHPTYFENFEKIRIGKSQREILKTLSNQFSDILEQDVPLDNPGLLTYDRYWEDIQKSQDLMAIPDIRKVKEITDTIGDKIESYFTGGRSSKKPVAKRIVNACAIKILQHELQKQNGTNAEYLVDDLCLTDKLALDREFLIDIIDTAANQIISATSGQYFDKDVENGQYHLRIEGGINFDQKIRDYAGTMDDSQKDLYFFKFLELSLLLSTETYRTGFKIWQHSIDWRSHKTYRDGYIFFGNPNQKSTTHPRQHFYLYFMPIFEEGKKTRNHEEDEVYFIFDNLSQEFRDAVTLYGAAIALEVRADTSQKAIYRQKIDELNKKARALFDQEYVQITQVDYQGEELPLNGFPLPGAGSSKEQIFSSVASILLENWFNDERPNYPKFTQLNAPLAKDNFDRLIKQALVKITNPEQANRDGEGILQGLGCWVPGMLDYSHSPYAKSLLKMLKDKGEGKVLNRDEIIEYVDRSEDLWLTKDFKIEAELEFVVMATLAALGEIEITLSSGKSINSTNLQDLKDIQKQDFFSFTHIKPPKGLNLAVLKTMFIGLLGRDLSNHLKDPSTYTHLVSASNDWARRTVTLLNKIQSGYTFKGIEIITEDQASEYRRHFTAFSGFCDKISTYTSEAKIKNFTFTADDLNRLLPYKAEVEQLEKRLNDLQSLQEDIYYLQQCKQYITSSEFKDEITSILNQLPEVVESNDTNQLTFYQQTLKQLKERYAEWYLDLYLKHRISQKDDTLKQSLLDSEEKAICDVLKEADFLSSGQYLIWLQKTHKLLPADSSVNKNLILTTPFHDFNPLDFIGADSFNISQLKKDLKDLLDHWDYTLKETLEDPVVKRNMNLLDEKTQKLLGDFKTGSVLLSKDNAIIIRNAIMDLHKGLEKVEMNVDEMKSTFNKPLTPDEAIEAFRTYIDQVSKGKERDKIRIVLK